MKLKVKLGFLLSIGILSCLVIFPLRSYAQKSSIEKSDIRIRLTKGGDAVQFGGTKAVLIAALGKPQSIEKYTFETLNEKGELITYNGNNFYFIKDKLMGF